VSCQRTLSSRPGEGTVLGRVWRGKDGRGSCFAGKTVARHSELVIVYTIANFGGGVEELGWGEGGGENSVSPHPRSGGQRN